MAVYLALFIVLAAGLAFATKAAKAHARRKQLAQAPPPENWIKILEANLPMATRFTGQQRTRLFSAMQLFLAEKQFEGCGGLEVTEEIKVTIAAQACMLLMGLEKKVYPRLDTVLVYPHTYTAGQKGLFGGDNGKSTRHGRQT